MMQYDIVAIFWDDHMQVTRQELVDDPDELFNKPMISVGILYRETEKAVLLVYDVENSNNATYIAILKSAIVARKKYGQIKLELGGE